MINLNKLGPICRQMYLEGKVEISKMCLELGLDSNFESSMHTLLFNALSGGSTGYESFESVVDQYQNSLGKRIKNSDDFRKKMKVVAYLNNIHIQQRDKYNKNK